MVETLEFDSGDERKNLRSTSKKDVRTILFSAFIGLYPILSAYSLPFLSRFDLGTLCVTIYLCYLLVSHFNECVIKKHCLIPLFLYVVIVTPVMLLLHECFVPLPFDYTVFSVVLRYGKFIVVLFTLFVIFDGHRFDFEIFLKTVRVVVYCACCYVIIQQVLYEIGGVIITNPVLQIFSSSGGGYSLSSDYYVVYQGMLRPSAFFLEPAHMTQYCVMYFAYVLFVDKAKNRLIDIVVLICGILCTTSAMGILAVVGLLAFWFVFHKHTKWDLVILLFVVVAGLLSLQIDFVQSALDRLLNNKYVITGRIGAGLKVWSELPWVYQVFGTGFGCVPSGFINGIEYILITIGAFGLVIVLGTLFYIVINVQKWKKVVILCYVVLLFGAQMFSVSSFIFLFSLVYSEIYSNKQFIFDRRKQKKRYLS